jgi:hypothetical protein
MHLLGQHLLGGNVSAFEDKITQGRAARSADNYSLLARSQA